MHGGMLIKASYNFGFIQLTFYLGVGRCFGMWQEVLGCYVVNTSAQDDSGKKKCAFALEDYYECLHHKKEVSHSPIQHN